MRKGMANGNEKKLVAQVATWVAGLLKGEVRPGRCPDRGPSMPQPDPLTLLLFLQNVTSSNPLGQPLPPATYISLLPTVWSLLNQPPPPAALKVKPSELALSEAQPEPEVSVPHTVAGALLDHLNRVGSDSAVKKIGVEFVGRLCLVSRPPIVCSNPPSDTTYLHLYLRSSRRCRCTPDRSELPPLRPWHHSSPRSTSSTSPYRRRSGSWVRKTSPHPRFVLASASFTCLLCH